MHYRLSLLLRLPFFFAFGFVFFTGVTEAAFCLAASRSLNRLNVAIPIYFLNALTAVELVTLTKKVPELAAATSASPTIVTPEPAVKVNL